jgi:hypothetical protein
MVSQSYFTPNNLTHQYYRSNTLFHLFFVLVGRRLPSNVVFYENSGDEFIAMRTMMHCDVIIVAHSSFSWWAAYLSNSMEIIAPRDIYPSNSIYHVEVTTNFLLLSLLLCW